MSRLLVYLGRFAVIILGFACAMVAASLFANVLIVGAFGWTDTAPFAFRGPVYFTVPFLAAFFGWHTLGPALAPILLAEFLGRRDWLFHALAGAVVALVTVIAACGIVGGIGYWAVAGRSAGRWLEGVTAPTR